MKGRENDLIAVGAAIEGAYAIYGGKLPERVNRRLAAVILLDLVDYADQVGVTDRVLGGLEIKDLQSTEAGEIKDLMAIKDLIENALHIWGVIPEHVERELAKRLVLAALKVALEAGAVEAKLLDGAIGIAFAEDLND